VNTKTTVIPTGASGVEDLFMQHLEMNRSLDYASLRRDDGKIGQMRMPLHRRAKVSAYERATPRGAHEPERYGSGTRSDESSSSLGAGCPAISRYTPEPMAVERSISMTAQTKGRIRHVALSVQDPWRPPILQAAVGLQKSLEPTARWPRASS